MQDADNFDFTDELECLYEDDFGTNASLLIKATDTTVTLRGVWNNPYYQRKFGEFIVDAEDPSFECVYTDDLADARQGDELTVNETVYFLQSEPQQDEIGACAMVLTPADTQDDMGQPDPEAGGTEKPTEAGSGMSGNLFNP